MEEVVFGLPGTGKTTYITKKAAEHDGVSGVYLSFGRQNADSVSKRLPSHVVSLSFHALARSYLNIHRDRLIDNMTMSPMGAILTSLGMRDKVRDLKILEALTLFYEVFIKTDVNVNQCHSIFDRSQYFPPLESKEKVLVISLFKAVWRAQISENTTTPISHDGYLKQLSLTDIKLDYEYIYVDEAQDMDDIMHVICENIRRNNPNAKMMIFGDPCQQIFGFRRASPRFGMMTPTRFLTQTHRFGRHIAQEANRFMLEQRLPYFSDIEAQHNDDVVHKGASFADVVGRIKSGERITFITRHNATVWSLIARLALQGLSCAINGSINRSEIHRIKALHALFLEQPQSMYKNTTFKRLRSRMELSQNHEGMLMCRFIETFSSTHPEIIASLENHIVAPRKADVFLSTTHQAKGLEFMNVVLASDFSGFYDSQTDRYTALPASKREDAHVFFTAMTRARKTLTLPVEMEEET